MNAWARLSLVLAAMSFFGSPAAKARGDDQLVIHEWGTFTTLQDDDGTQLPGINVDDEQLPAFVHTLGASLLRPDLRAAPPQPNVRSGGKGVPKTHNDVKLRLETPVVYFYPPVGKTLPMELDVHVDFRGGWLTEFYPQAEADAPGLTQGTFDFGQLDETTVGSLTWRKLQVGTTTPGPASDSAVWTLPRQVQSVGLTASSGESEKYLFYRGVGNFLAPLWVVSPTTTVSCYTALRGLPAEAFPLKIGPLWLIHVRPDGKSAFRELPPIEAVDAKTRDVLRTPREFLEFDFSTAATDQLSASMHSSLVQAGLFPDEATAMLATWRKAYLTSPGLRLFYIVPRSWVDFRLPLTISEPAQVERVMMARTELVSPEQRALLARLREMSVFDESWMDQAREAPGYARLAAGRSDFGDLGVPIPPDFQTYLDLGRFRSVLLATEARQRPNKNLLAFTRAYGLMFDRPQGKP
jgi:hypothetical protein